MIIVINSKLPVNTRDIRVRLLKIMHVNNFKLNSQNMLLEINRFSFFFPQFTTPMLPCSNLYMTVTPKLWGIYWPLSLLT